MRASPHLPVPETVVTISKATVSIRLRGGKRWPKGDASSVLGRTTADDVVKLSFKHIHLSQEWFAATASAVSMLRLSVLQIDIVDKARGCVTHREFTARSCKRASPMCC